jgi:predicted O-methyltransferase YrrM
MSIKGIIPNSIKAYLKKYTNLANLIDRILQQREISVFTDIPTLLSGNEREYLYKLAKRVPKQGKILEIGCFAGGSTYFLTKGSTNVEAQVFTIDPFNYLFEKQKRIGDGSDYLYNGTKKPSKIDVRNNLNRNGINNSVILIEGFSREIASSWKNGGIDLLWIDGNHLEAYEDFSAWRPHLKSKSTVAFHDTNYPTYGRKEVYEAVNRIILEEQPTSIERLEAITTIHIEK